MASASAPLPSIFLSYASEDRVAVRRLRDVLTATGLDVWYDENELGGGDAWDQKIRRQIRECTYFMPVISATTEARREGYFRREWRLATERTLDMADDVTFLLPIVLDHTRQDGARVPEKFNAVQWLRAPGGESTPALLALCRRLLAEHGLGPTEAPDPEPPPPLPPGRGLVRPASAATPSGAPTAPPPPPSPSPRTGRAGSHAEGAPDRTPPPMPPFPHAPSAESGHGLKYVAEIFWWVLTVAWIVVKRLPRWARVLLTIWAVFLLLGRCSSSDNNNSNRDRPPRPPASSTENRDKPRSDAERAQREETRKALTDVANRLKESSKEDPAGLGSGLARVGSDLARQMAAEIPAEEPVEYGLLPFQIGVNEPRTARFAGAVFEAAYGRLALRLRGGLGVVKLNRPETTAPDDKELLEAARTGGFTHTIVGGIETTPEGDFLVVRTLVTATGALRWTQRFPLAGADPLEVAAQVADGAVTTPIEKP